MQSTLRPFKLKEVVEAIDSENYVKANSIVLEYQAMFKYDERFVPDVIAECFEDIAFNYILKILKFLDIISVGEKVNGFNFLLTFMDLNGEIAIPQIFYFITYLQKSIAVPKNPPKLSDVKTLFYAAVRNNLPDLTTSITDPNKWDFSFGFYNADLDGYLTDLLEIFLKAAVNLEVETLMDYVKQLTLPQHILVVHQFAWRQTKMLNKPITFIVAYQMMQAMSNVSGSIYDSYIFMKKALPITLQTIIWVQVVTLKNVKFNEFLFSPVGYDYDSNGKYAFNWIPGDDNGLSARWRILTFDEGRTFELLSLSNNQYLYPANSSLNFDSSKRRVFTQRLGSRVAQGQWLIDIIDDDDIYIRSAAFNESLISSDSLYDNARRFVFTWISPVDGNIWRLG